MNSPEKKQFTENDHIYDTKQITDYGVEIELQVRPFFKETQFFVGGDLDSPLFTPNHVQRMLEIGLLEDYRYIYDVIFDHKLQLEYGIDYITISNEKFEYNLIALSQKLVELSKHKLISNDICIPSYDPFSTQFSENPLHMFTLQGIARLAELESQSVRERIKGRFESFIPTIQNWYRDYIELLEERTYTLQDYPIPDLGYREGMQIEA